jgi:starch-binding outer membrane protein, SusD/RagB family
MKNTDMMTTIKIYNMKKKLVIGLYAAIIISGLALLIGGCKDAFDIEANNAVEAKNAYQTVSDADAAVLGVYSLFLDLGAQYVVLNELRGDLIDITSNSGESLQRLNSHSDDVNIDKVSSNAAVEGYGDPKPFYKVILNCNDVLKNLTVMHTKSLLTDDEYNQRYSDIKAVRCWIYLQLAIHFGNVPYVTTPYQSVSDLSDTITRLPLTTMIDTLVETMTHLPTLGSYPSTATLYNISSGTYGTRSFFVNKHILLADLYLWKGDYLNAATNYKIVMDGPGESDLNTFRMRGEDVTYHKDFAVGYWQRYQHSSIDGLVDDDTYGWRSMFCRGQDSYYYYEWIWQLFYDNANGSSSPFIELFANYGQGKYLLKPSQEVIDLWNSQTQSNSFPYDARGVLSYTTKNGQPVVRKYLYEYDETLPYEKPGRLFLYRAAGMMLHYIEAANRDNKCKVALACLNSGIRSEFSPYWYSGYDTIQDLTNVECTTGSYYNFTYPYDFAAQVGGTVSVTRPNSTSKVAFTQYPVNARGAWELFAGVRGRAYVAPVLRDMYNPLALTVSNSSEMKDAIENKVLDEDALELAFEGERWADLLRVAIRRDDPSILANRIYSKLSKAGNANAAEARTKLLNRQWFLPFSLK